MFTFLYFSCTRVCSDHRTVSESSYFLQIKVPYLDTIIVEKIFRVLSFNINGSIILSRKPIYMWIGFLFNIFKHAKYIWEKREMYSNLELQGKYMKCKSLFILIHAVSCTCVHQTIFIMQHKNKFVQKN